LQLLDAEAVKLFKLGKAAEAGDAWKMETIGWRWSAIRLLHGIIGQSSIELLALKTNENNLKLH
jgi:hypothetical protein